MQFFSSPTAARTDTRREHDSAGACGGIFLTILAILVLAASGAQARSWSYDLAGELMSPYCPGRTLSSCPSSQAAELVQWIAIQEAGGATQEQVVEMLIERFGEEILGAPPAKGMMLWVYVSLVMSFVVGGGLVVVTLRRIVARGAVPDSASQDGPVDDDLARRIDADLADLSARS